MPELSALMIFVAASLALVITPGPAVLYIVTRSIEQGRIAGLASVLGIATGGIVHVIAAALGVSAILMTSALAFNVVKLAGAAYLIYLGIQKLHESGDLIANDELQTRPLSHVYREGIVVNVLNPKTALFFFAFLPQFVNPDGAPVAAQVTMLGALFITLAIISDSVYALVAGSIRAWLGRRRRFLSGLKYYSAAVYILLGLSTAFSGAHAKK